MQFDFGENWLGFSQHALTPEKVAQAKQDFSILIKGIDLLNRSFLDVGFGQGLTLLAASEMGASVIGNDINPKCIKALEQNVKFFPSVSLFDIPIVMGSILDNAVVGELMEKSPGREGYDIVHSWGVLHHTGDMKKAIQNTASMVRPGGHLILALYNRHWTSPVWLIIKWLYCKSPQIIKKIMVVALFPIIYGAKFIVTGKNPKKQSRGMDFYYDVIDWVGGYPYEYAAIGEMEPFISLMGFKKIKSIPAQVPTGCNEFIFEKKKF